MDLKGAEEDAYCASDREIFRGFVQEDNVSVYHLSLGQAQILIQFASFDGFECKHQFPKSFLPHQLR